MFRKTKRVNIFLDDNLPEAIFVIALLSRLIFEKFSWVY